MCASTAASGSQQSSSKRSAPAASALEQAEEALGTLAWLNIVPEHGSIEIGYVCFSAMQEGQCWDVKLGALKVALEKGEGKS